MIKTVSGALTKINKKSPHAADQKMVLATHRTAPTQNPNCSRLFIRGLSSVTRNTPVTATELAVRTKFAAVSAQVATAMKGAGVTQYLNEFNAQKDQPGGKKTMKAFLWKKFGDVYDENQG